MTRPSTNYCILIPAWGQRYVARALDYCLASLMSTGNIHALLPADRVTLVFLTEKSSGAHFEQHALVKNLPPGVAAEFIWIDDLIIPPSYGVTLTLAYARAIKQLQDAEIKPVFIFANADFVFSDGALAYIRDAMREGADGVACPSVRCVEDRVLEHLDARRDSAGLLNLPTDFLIEQIYDSPHMTDMAATLKNHYLHHTNPNHFFIGDWQTELVGFWYLRFMLAIRPVQRLDRVQCFCDYSFMAQMVPADRIDYPTDGHDIFLLELSGANQESSFVALGSEEPPEIARRLQQFTTDFHRQCAQHPYFIERRPSPERRAALLRRMRSAHEEIERHFTVPPHDWQNHPYWNAAIIHLRLQGYRFPETLITPIKTKYRRYAFYVGYKLAIVSHWRRHLGHVLKASLSIALFRPAAKFIFVNFFLRPLPALRDISDLLRGGDILVLSSFKLAEYLCAFSKSNAVLIDSNDEMAALLSSRKNEVSKVVFIGDAHDYVAFQKTIAAPFAAKLDVILEVVFLPNHASNRQLQVFIGLVLAAELTRDVSYSPGAGHLIKAEAILQVLNHLGGFLLVSRAMALTIFILETLFAGATGHFPRRRARPRLWNVMTTRPRPHAPTAPPQAADRAPSKNVRPHKVYEDQQNTG